MHRGFQFVWFLVDYAGNFHDISICYPYCDSLKNHVIATRSETKELTKNINGIEVSYQV